MPSSAPVDGGVSRRRPATHLGAVVLTLALIGSACSSSGDDAQAGDSSKAITTESVSGSFGTLDRIVGDVMDKTGIPGVAVAVVYGDKAVYEQGYGVRSTATKQPVKPETVFQIASLSKPVSATIMAGLAGEGVFAWGDPIADYAPELKLSDQWVTEHVTFADLFAHRSGIPGGPAGNDLEGVGFDRATILERLRLVPLDPFRITYSYSNFGMTMAGEAAARAAGTTWEQAARDVLFEPAGMTSTSMSHADFLTRKNRSALHVERDGKWVPEYDRMPDAQAPAGGVSSNVVDLAQWMRINLADGKLGKKRIIDADTLAMTHTPQIMNRPPAPTIGNAASFYGLGWVINTDSTGTIRWEHSGAFSNGAATAVSMVPTDGLGIVVLTNAAPIGAPEAIAHAYIDALRTRDPDVKGNLKQWTKRFAGVYGEPELTPADRPTNPTPARPDNAYVGTYANDYVGEVEIRAGENGLELVVGPEPRAFRLEHWNADTFAYPDAPELPDFLSSVVFEVGDSDRADQVTIGAFNGAGLGTLTRR